MDHIDELADTLAREQSLPFGTAHAISRRLVAARQKDAARPLSELLAEASAAVTGSSIDYSEDRLAAILSPRHFVAVRRTWGGPAPEETARAAGVARVQLDTAEEWWRSATGNLREAALGLATRSAEL